MEGKISLYNTVIPHPVSQFAFDLQRFAFKKADTAPTGALFSVTKSDGTYYGTATADFKTANVGDATEITLIKKFTFANPVTLSNDCTLNLESFILTFGDKTTKDTSYGITTSKKLTVTGTTGYISASNTKATDTEPSYTRYAVKVESNSELEIKSGKISGKVENNGTFNLNGGTSTTVTNNGTLTVSGGTATTVTNNTGATLTVTSGKATTVTNSGTFNLNGGTSTTVTNSGTLTINGGTATTVTNNGTFNLNSGTAGASKKAITNNAGATFTMTGGTVAASTTFTNSGTLNQTGGTISATVTNNANATLTVNGENAKVYRVTNSGKFELKSGTVTYTSTGVTNSANSEFTISGGTVSGAVSNSGTLTQSGGTVKSTITNNADSEFTMSDGNVVSVTNKGKFDLNGGKSTGTVTNNADSTFTVNGGTATTVKNSGTLNLSNGSITGTVTNNTGATFTMSGSGTKTTTVNNSGTFTMNDGTVSSSVTNNSSGQLTLEKGYINSTRNSGNFVMNGGIAGVTNYGTGTFTMNNGSLYAGNSGGTMNIAGGTAYTLRNTGGIASKFNLTGGTIYNDFSEYVGSGTDFVLLDDVLYVGKDYTENSDEKIKNAKVLYAENKVIIDDGEEKYYTTEEKATAAADAVAAIGDKLYSTLDKAVKAAKSGDVIEILRDFTTSSGDIVVQQKEITLDLKGHNIKTSASTLFDVMPKSYFEDTSTKTATNIPATSLTIANTGGDDSGYHGSIRSADNGWAIVVVGDGNEDHAPTLIVNGGYISSEGSEGVAISGIGNAPSGTKTRDDRYINIIINDGNMVGGSNEGLGIYMPGEGALNVNGGTITGATGIEIRSGSLDITGGTIQAGYFQEKKDEQGNVVKDEDGNVVKEFVAATEAFTSPNGSGSTSVGVGIAVAQHTTKKLIDVKISGYNTKVIGANAMAVSNPQNNASSETVGNIDIQIESGTFEATGTMTTVKDSKGNVISTVEGANAIYYDDARSDFTVTDGDFKGNITAGENAKEKVTQEDGTVVTKVITENVAIKGGTYEANSNVTEFLSSDNETIPATNSDGMVTIAKKVVGWNNVSGTSYDYVIYTRKPEDETKLVEKVLLTATSVTDSVSQLKVDKVANNLLGLEEAVSFTWGDVADSIKSDFHLTKFKTGEGVVTITPQTEGVKIDSTVLAGSATSLVASGSYGIYVDAANNSLVNMKGDKGNDIFRAGKSATTIDGGAGDDTAVGGAGKDVFFYSSGNDVVDSFNKDDIVIMTGTQKPVTSGDSLIAGSADFTLRFDENNSLAFKNVLTDSRTVSVQSGEDVYTYTKDTIKLGKSITLAAGHGNYFDAAENDVDSIDAAAVVNPIHIKGNANDNLLVGSKMGGTLEGTSGNDTLVGSDDKEKSDHFIYLSGNDIIKNYDIEVDTVELKSKPSTSFDKIKFTGDDYIIGVGSDSLTFKGVSKVKLSQGTDSIYYTADRVIINDERITLGSEYSGKTFDVKQTEGYESITSIDASAITTAGGLTINGLSDKNSSIIGASSGGKVYGGSKGDTLKATNGKTTLDGGLGDDLLIGGNGSDVFYYTGGVDSISGYGSGDLVSVKPEFKPAEANIAVDDNNITLTFDNSNKLVFEDVKDAAVSLRSGNKTYAYAKEYVALDDSITLTSKFTDTNFASGDYNNVDASVAGVATGISIVGNDNNNYIIGSATKANSLDGGKGNDTLKGGSAADLFFYTTGNDVIENFGTNDKLAIDNDAIKKARAISNKLVFTMGDKNNVLTFKSEGSALEKVSLESGGYLTKDGIVKDNNFKLFSSAKGKIEIANGITSVNASNADKQSVTLVAGSVASGSTLDVTFASKNKKKDGFEYGGGNVSISGYEGGKDKINLGDATISGFSVTDKTVAISVSGGVISIAGAQGEEVLIHQDGVNKGNSYSKMVFKETGVLENKKKNPTQATVIAGVKGGFSAVNDATVKNITISSGVSAVSIQAGNKNNTLIDASAAGAVSLIGGTKNDKLIGSKQADTFVYSAGKDIILGYDESDKISLSDDKLDIENAKITASKKSIKFKFNSKSTLMLKGDGISGSKIKINDTDYLYAKNAIVNGESSVSLTSQFSGTYKIEKNDGTKVIDGHLVKKSLTLKGTSADEKLIGGTSKTTFKGGGGKDTLVGGDGKDTFFFAKGDKDTVTIQNFDFTNDKLKLADGILKEISQSGNSSILFATTSDGKKKSAIDGGLNITSFKDTLGSALIKANNTYYWFEDEEFTDSTGEKQKDVWVTSISKISDSTAKGLSSKGYSIIDLNYSTNLVKSGVAYKTDDFTVNSNGITKKTTT